MAIGTVPGYKILSPPKDTIAGIKTNQPRTAPANIYEAIRIPQIYPTPISAGYTCTENNVFKELTGTITAPGITFIPSTIYLTRAAIPMPKKTVFAPLPPSSPASSTSAHAVPSGYGSTPCSFTINALRSGTIKSTPRTPPHKASAVMVNKSGVSAFPSSAAPKTTANKTPTITAVMLNSFICFSAGTKGLNSSFSFSKAMPPVLVFLLAYPNY